jgi:drug/metabolite transporter (DMT)-like permease
MIHGIYLGGVFWAIDHGMPAGLSALIIGLQPLVTTLLAGAFLGERVLPRHWVGLAVGFVGVVIVLSPRLGTIGGGVDAGPSAPACCRWWHLGRHGLAEALRLGRRPPDRHAVAICRRRGAGQRSPPGCWRPAATGSPANSSSPWPGWCWCCRSAPILLLMYLIRDGAVARVSSLFYLVPGVTAVLAWLLFGETLSPIQIGGIVVPRSASRWRPAAA